MALTPLQRSICRLLADSRIASGESYVAGGAALNELLAAPRISRDVDLFYDTESALDQSYSGDLPADQAGKCVLDQQGRLFTGLGEALRDALGRRGLVFRPGSIRGVLPRVVEAQGW